MEGQEAKIAMLDRIATYKIINNRDVARNAMETLEALAGVVKYAGLEPTKPLYYEKGTRLIMSLIIMGKAGMDAANAEYELAIHLNKGEENARFACRLGRSGANKTFIHLRYAISHLVKGIEKQLKRYGKDPYEEAIAWAWAAHSSLGVLKYGLLFQENPAKAFENWKGYFNTHNAVVLKDDIENILHMTKKQFDSLAWNVQMTLSRLALAAREACMNMQSHLNGDTEVTDRMLILNVATSLHQAIWPEWNGSQRVVDRGVGHPLIPYMTADDMELDALEAIKIVSDRVKDDFSTENFVVRAKIDGDWAYVTEHTSLILNTSRDPNKSLTFRNRTKALRLIAKLNQAGHKHYFTIVSLDGAIEEYDCTEKRGKKPVNKWIIKGKVQYRNGKPPKIMYITSKVGNIGPLKKQAIPFRSKKSALSFVQKHDHKWALDEVRVMQLTTDA